MYPYHIGIIMYITLECDGACNAHGQTSIGIIIRKTIENGSKRIEDKITKLTGTGTAATAEFRAIITALGIVRDNILSGGELLTIEGIIVYNDNRLINEIINGTRVADSEELFRLNQDVQELRKFFFESNIKGPVFKWRHRNHIKQAHDLAYGTLYGGGYDLYSQNIKVLKAAKSGDCLIPFSVFTRKELSQLTANEILVMYMIDERGYQVSKLAKELRRDYNTIHTAYVRAKGKSSGMTPPRKLKRARSNPERGQGIKSK